MGHFVNKLTVVMADKRVSATELAHKVAVTRSAVSAWRNDKYAMSLDTLARVSTALGCKPWDIMRWVEDDEERRQTAVLPPKNKGQ